MGWKGTVRSVRAAYRAAERERIREQKALEREEKEYQKELARENARDEFEEYQEYYYMLKSFHGQSIKPIDWNKIHSKKPPGKPKNLRKREKKSRLKLENYKPGFFDKLFKLEEKKKSRLANDLDAAITSDKKEFESKLVLWDEKHQKWELENCFAQRIINEEFDAKIEALENYFDDSDLFDLGVNISFEQLNQQEIRILIQSGGIDVIPTETKSLLQSGKLSTKKMPIGKYYELYQDHICSVLLKCANDFFSIINDNRVFIDVQDKVLDLKTGHKKSVPILSSCISRTTLAEINLKKVDPSECITNFIHNMSFKKTKGFEEVSLIDRNLD